MANAVQSEMHNCVTAPALEFIGNVDGSSNSHVDWDDFHFQLLGEA